MLRPPGRNNNFSNSLGRCIATIRTGFRRLRIDEKELVGYMPHPFYARNSVQTFIACRGDEVCGRIAAIINQGHIAHHNDRRGFFGFFDCRDDQEAADGLFDAVRCWLAEQDIHAVRGPTNPVAELRSWAC